MTQRGYQKTREGILWKDSSYKLEVGSKPDIVSALETSTMWQPWPDLS